MHSTQDLGPSGSSRTSHESTPIESGNGRVLNPLGESFGPARLQQAISLTHPDWQDLIGSLLNGKLNLNGRMRTKLSQMASPTTIYAFVESQRETISDAQFFVALPGSGYTDTQWYDAPFDGHARGGNLSFVDGHLEHHRWRWRKPRAFFTAAANAQDQEDLHWLQQRLP